MCGIETESSATMIEPEPSIEPASAIDSKLYGRSSSAGVKTGDDDPPAAPLGFSGIRPGS